MRVKPLSERTKMKLQSLQEQIDAAFWSVRLSEQEWKKRMRNPKKHLSTILHSLVWMKPETVIPAITRKTFSRQWPSWRQQIVAMEGPIAEASRQVFDAFWGVTTLSDSQHKPLPVFSAIGEKRRDLLRFFIENPGATVYDAKKATHRDYARLHKDTDWLERHDLIERSEAEQGIRTRIPVWAKHSINVALSPRFPY